MLPRMITVITGNYKDEKEAKFFRYYQIFKTLGIYKGFLKSSYGFLTFWRIFEKMLQNIPRWYLFCPYFLSKPPFSTKFT